MPGGFKFYFPQIRSDGRKTVRHFQTTFENKCFMCRLAVVVLLKLTQNTLECLHFIVYTTHGDGSPFVCKKKYVNKR